MPLPWRTDLVRALSDLHVFHVFKGSAEFGFCRIREINRQKLLPLNHASFQRIPDCAFKKILADWAIGYVEKCS
jgi:hypothetical protein